MVSDQFAYTAVTIMDSNHLSLCVQFGGCAILYRNYLLSCIPPMQTNSKRFCAVHLSDCFHTPGHVYLPIGHRTLEEFVSCLKAFLESQSYDSLILM